MKTAAATQARDAQPDLAAAPTTTPAPGARRIRPAAPGGGHFAEVPTAANGDADGEALKALLIHMAGQLGIRPGSIEIRTGPDAERLTGERGARGVAHEGVIHIPQARLAPRTSEGRRLLAHEAAHVAQMRLPAPARPRLRARAEVEAETFARRYAATRVAEPMRVALTPQAVVADTDFDAVAATAALNHPQEIAAITELLSYGAFDWAITNGDVFDILQILASYILPVSRGIVAGLEPKYRARLYDNLNPAHYAAHRAEILAACWGAQAEGEFADAKYAVLVPMNLQDLGAEEAIALNGVTGLFPKLVHTATEADAAKAGHIDKARTYVTSGKAATDADKEIGEGLASELRLTALREQAKELREGVRQLDPNGEAFAARIIARLDAGELEALDAEQILTDISVEVLRVLDQRLAAEYFAIRVGVPRINKLLDRVPARALYRDRDLRNAFVQLAAVRPAYLNARLAEDLTTSPWWKVWDDVAVDEAYTAYLLVKALPVRGRAAFLKGRGGDKWKAVLAALPASIREDPAFNFYGGDKLEKVAQQTDRQGLLTALMDDELWTQAATDPVVAPPSADDPAGQPAAAPKYDPLEKLEALIRLAQAADEGPFVFEQSRRQAAWSKPRLAGLVETYRLFVPKTRETYETRVLPTENSGGSSWGKLLFGLRNFSLNRKTGAIGVDVNISDATEFAGVRFRETTAEQQDAAEEAGVLADNVIHVEYGKNSIVADAPRLVIDGLAIVGESAIHAGPVECSGLHLDLRYVPGLTRFSIKRLLSLDVRFDELKLENCSFAGGAALFGFKSMRMTGARLRLMNQDTEDAPEAVWISSIFDVLMNPAKATNTSLAFDLLAFRSVATSGGLFVDSVEIDGFEIHAGGDASAYVEGLILSLGRLKPRAAAERDAARTDPENAERHLQQAERIDKQIAKTQAEVDRGEPHGSVVDIRAIRISGVPGISEEPLAFEDIHGQGRSVTAIVPIFADPTSIRNMIRGSQAAPTVRGKQAAEETFSIDIGRIEGKQPLRLAGAIPTTEKAQAEYDDYLKASAAKRYDAHWTAVEQALRDRATQARRYHELADKGVQFLSEPEAVEFRRLRGALTAFEERRATIVEALTLEGVSLNISSDGNPELVAETFKTGAIRTFGPDGVETFSIGGVEGRNVTVGAALQGGLANYKDWKKALRSGTLKADHLTLKDIRFAGLDASIDELSFEGQGDAKGLDVAFNRGTAATGGASAIVRSGKIVAKGLNGPAQVALIKAELARIEAIKPDTDRTKDELKRLLTIARMLLDYDRITKAKGAAELAAAKAKSKTQRAAAAKALEKAELSLKDWQDRLVVEKLTVDQLDLSISGLGDVLAEGYAFDKDAKDLTLKGGTDGKPWFQQVQAEGVRRRGDKGDQTVAERITIGPVGGEVKRTAKGYALNGLTIASIAAKGVSWQSGKTTIQSIGESRLEGVSISATYEKDGGTTKLSVTHAAIKQIVADQLRYENESAVVTVKSGALVGIAITNLNVTLPEEGDTVIEAGGQVAVQKVQALAIDAVVGGKKVVGQVDSTTPTATANAITVDFAKAGERSLSLLGLDGAAQVTDLKTGGRLHVALKHVSGKIIQTSENDFEVRNLSIPDVSVTGIHWIAGDYTIDVADKVTLAGIQLDADASLKPKALKKGETPKLDDDGKPIVEKELGKLLVRKLTVSEIAAHAVKVTSPRIPPKVGSTDKVKPEKTIELKEAVIKGVRMTGFDVLNRTGKVEVTDSVKVTDLKATIGSEATKDLKKGTASFAIYGKDAKEPGAKARELSATLTAKDGTTLKLGRTQDLRITDVELLSEVEGKPGQTTDIKVKSVTVPGITAEAVLVKDDSVVVSKLEIEAPVWVDDVSWEGTIGGKSLTLHQAKIEQAITIGTIDARFKTVPRKDPKPGEEKTESELQSVTAKDLSIPKITTDTLIYKGPSGEPDEPDRVTLNIPQATIEGVVFPELGKDFIANTMTLKGGVKKISAPGFTATLAKSVSDLRDARTFSGAVVADDFTADAVLRTTKVGGEDKTSIDSGSFRITKLGLKHLKSRVPTPADSETHPFTLGGSQLFKPPSGEDPADGFEAEVNGIGVDAKGVKIDSADVHSLAFEDPDLGLSIDIQDMRIPKGVAIPDSGPITVPEGVITNAHFRLKSLGALMGDKDPGGDSLLKAQDKEALLDHLNGQINGQIYVPIYVGAGLQVRQDVFPLDLTVTDGKLDYKKAFDKATWLRNDLIASLQMDTDAVKQGGRGAVADWSKSYLTLEVAGSNLKSWTPADQAERKEMTGGQVRLKRLIKPDVPPKDDDEEKEDPNARKAIDADRIELREVDATLGVKGEVPLQLGDLGHITLGTAGRDGLSDLHVVGKDKNHVSWSVGGFAVGVDDLNIKGNKLRGASGGPAQILIDGVKDGGLDFTGGKITKPGALEGTITSATVRNLALDRAGKK